MGLGYCWANQGRSHGGFWLGCFFGFRVLGFETNLLEESFLAYCQHRDGGAAA